MRFACFALSNDSRFSKCVFTNTKTLYVGRQSYIVYFVLPAGSYQCVLPSPSTHVAQLFSSLLQFSLFKTPFIFAALSWSWCVFFHMIYHGNSRFGEQFELWLSVHAGCRDRNIRFRKIVYPTKFNKIHIQGRYHPVVDWEMYKAGRIKF